jgi:hypothetical protein
VQQHQIDHIRSRTCWETVGLQEGMTKIALIVETDVIQDPMAEGFDAEEFQSLKDAVQDYVALQTHIDMVVFYKIGDH